MLRPLSALLLLICFAASAAPALAQSYKIKLVRPLKAGQQYSHHVTASVRESADTALHGQPPVNQTESFSIQMQGTVTVGAVNARTGGVTKLSCKVDSFTRDGQPLCAPGTVITAEKQGSKSIFKLNGKPADAADQEALESALQISDPKGQFSNDELTGTKAAQKAGDSWPIDAAKVARQISTSGLPITPDITQGNSTLVKLDGLHDETMTIQTLITADGFKKQMPDGSVMSNGKLRLEANSALAVDPSIPGGTSTTKMHVTMTITRPSQVSNVTVDRDATEENHPI